MPTEKIPLKVTAAHLARAVRNLAKSEVGAKAKWMFVGLVALLIGANGLNVVNSFVNRNLMTAIVNRSMDGFLWLAMLSIGLYAVSTVVAVIARFGEERLGLLWREFATRRTIQLYLANGAYDRLNASGELSNPDQRIAEDVHTFTVMALSFVLMALNSALTILAFWHVLLAISPLLAVVAAAYAACGSCLALVLGRPLVQLNSDQLDKEASFRSALIHVRDNADSIMLERAEEPQRARLLHRLDDLVANFRKITALNRNVGFFTTGYNWLIAIIPTLIIAPAYIRGDIEFGVVTQSAMAFSTVVAGSSLIVNQYQSLSYFAAVGARLQSLMVALEQNAETPAIELVEAEGRLAYEGVTLTSATGAPLLKDLSISIPLGARVLVYGSNPAAGTTLFKATAGFSVAGAGRIVRPGADDLHFLTQRPYLPPGALRDVLAPAARESEVSDAQITELLRALNLELGLSQAGGPDSEPNWNTLLSPRDQLLLSFVRLLLAKPRFVFLDGVAAALGSDSARTILNMLSERSIAYLDHAQSDAPRDLYDSALECKDDGGWTWTAYDVGFARTAGAGYQAASNSETRVVWNDEAARHPQRQIYSLSEA